MIPSTQVYGFIPNNLFILTNKLEKKAKRLALSLGKKKGEEKAKNNLYLIKKTSNGFSLAILIS